MDDMDEKGSQINVQLEGGKDCRSLAELEHRGGALWLVVQRQLLVPACQC
jgi:hypothetical protein